MSLEPKYFADIPVYRLSAEQYDAEFERHLDRQYKDPAWVGSDVRAFHDRNPQIGQSYRNRAWEHFGGAWRYNEIIGFIRLHFLGSQVRGEWWRIKGERIVRSRRKLFEYRHWKLVYESDIPHDATNAEIWAIICEYVERCRKELPGRFVDSQVVDRIGPFVDWRALLEGE